MSWRNRRRILLAICSVVWADCGRRGALVPLDPGMWSAGGDRDAISSLFNQKREMSPSSLYRSFGLLCLASLILWWHTLITTLELALRDDEYSHILLVLPISVVLIFVDWRLHKPQPEPNFRAGLALLVIAVVIGSIGGWLCGRGGLAVDLRLTLGMLTVVTWWIGSFVYCFGTSISRICLFPLCFLLWVVPLPAFALHHIVSFLQQGSAYAARLLFTMARVPVAQDGCDYRS